MSHSRYYTRDNPHPKLHKWARLELRAEYTTYAVSTDRRPNGRRIDKVTMECPTCGFKSNWDASTYAKTDWECNGLGRMRRAKGKE